MITTVEPEKTDHWIGVANALRDAALDHQSVLRLVQHRRYETRGRGPTVSGISLSHDGILAKACIGVVLLSPRRGETVASIAKDLRGRLHNAWARQHSADPIIVHIDVLGIDSADEV